MNDALGRFLIVALTVCVIAGFWLLYGCAQADVLRLNLWVTDVRCGQWERMDNGVWRAEGPAIVELEDGGRLIVSRADVTERSAPQLYFMLEVLCWDAADGGW